jgi:hypothetical protein
MIRTLVLGLVGAVALSTAGTALAAFTTPKLTVSDAGTAVTIDYTQSAGDDAPASVKIYVPAGYSTSLAQAAGTTIGTVTAQGTAADLGGALLPLTGSIQTRAASGTYLSNGSQRPLATASTECTGTANHTAFWVLILQAAGQTLELPAYVDDVTTAPTSAFAKATIQFCLPPPDLPAGHPSRAAFGFKLTQANLRVENTFTRSGNGPFRWRATATPWRPLVGQPNAAATVEIQSVVAYPRSLTLRRVVTVKNRVATVRLTGALALPQGETGTVRIFRGSRAVTAARVSGSSFTASLRVKQTARKQTFALLARVTVPAADLGAAGCQPTFGSVGVPCVSATRAGYTVQSAPVTVTIPKRK